MLKLIWLIPLLPFFGFLIIGLFGKRLRLSERVIAFIACGSVAISLILSIGAVIEYASSYAPRPYLSSEAGQGFPYSFTWVPGGKAILSEGQAAGAAAEFLVNWSYQLDPLSAVMILVVTGVGFLIHVFAVGYMAGDTGFYRFFAYLNLFMFMMLILVMGSNFLMMFVGWEGVGLCSYLLIGYYFDRQEAGDASKKAFIVNRIGDFGFALAIFGVFSVFGTLEFTQVAEAIKAYPVEAFGAFGLMSWIALGLFIGATGKSAQIPLYIWLPDAMAGPTPVSALIHAATMVTAGVYMVTRTNFIFQRSVTMMFVVALVGVLTAFVAATIAFSQTDIKKVLAYSTVSQLGYMFLGCGVGAFFAGIFHLMTHAFFKALMFLGSGSVIHGMHHEQDMRLMGGLKKYMPVTFWTFAAGWIAICGILPFAGFFSKDEILWRAFITDIPGGRILWVIGFITAGFTAFYMTRLMALTFWGQYRYNDPAVQKEVYGEHRAAHAHGAHDHDLLHGDVEEDKKAVEHAHEAGRGGQFFPHESPKVMTIPLIVLAVLSVVGGWIGWPQALGGSNHFEHWIEPVIEKVDRAHSSEAQGRLQLPGEAAVAAKAQGHGESAASEGAHGDEGHNVVEYALMGASMAWALLGMYLAYFLYIKRRALLDRIVSAIHPLYVGSKNLWYWDYLLDVKVVNLFKGLNNLLWSIDAKGVDGGVNGSAWLTRLSSVVSGLIDKYVVDMAVNSVGWFVRIGSIVFRTIQTGFAQNYALVMVLGLLAFVGYYLLSR